MKKIIITLAAAICCVAGASAAPLTDSLKPKSAIDTLKTKAAIDTLATADKYRKVVLYSNNTWEYIELDRPAISDDDFADNWDIESIHICKDIPVSSLPAEVDLLLADSTHGWCAPITGRVSSGFKFRKTRNHNGTDIPLTVGDTIRAAFDGKVRVVRTVGNAGGYGNLMVIRHPNGLETYYAHLSGFIVNENELVKAGEPIALGGNTGRSTGPHLHFEVRYMGKPFDSERIFDFTTGEIRQTEFTLKRHYFNIYSHYGMTDAESAATQERVYHTVRSGDTLGAIARKYNTTVARICKLNGISQNKILRLGQKLAVR
ncbi:MAG: peptidoglycan DD-metalloendopeptidase family protein [Bacteroidales bacterium]|nr:peptidoglycan DD-metalloendopeptidase family protein [Bacteroidales bacterium]